MFIDNFLAEFLKELPTAPWQRCLIEYNIYFSGKHIGILQLSRKNYPFTHTSATVCLSSTGINVLQVRVN